MTDIHQKQHAPERPITVSPLIWRGVTIEVSLEADYLGMSAKFPDAAHEHLQVRVLAPEGAVLPITETGYRSHFQPCGTAAAQGGVKAFVLAWLDHAAQSPAWKAQEAASRQMSLL